jgi:hypothetical protein
MDFLIKNVSSTIPINVLYKWIIGEIQWLTCKCLNLKQILKFLKELIFTRPGYHLAFPHSGSQSEVKESI